MVVGALIYLLGIDLLKEALIDTVGRVSRFEYLTIWAILITMTVIDFVVGIGVGIVVACVSFVVQSSQRTAVRVSPWLSCCHLISMQNIHTIHSAS